MCKRVAVSSACLQRGRLSALPAGQVSHHVPLEDIANKAIIHTVERSTAYGDAVDPQTIAAIRRDVSQKLCRDFVHCEMTSKIACGEAWATPCSAPSISRAPAFSEDLIEDECH